MTFADIKTVSTGGRGILDLSLSSTNQKLTVITLEPSEGSESNILLYEVGRYGSSILFFMPLSPSPPLLFFTRAFFKPFADGDDRKRLRSWTTSGMQDSVVSRTLTAITKKRRKKKTPATMIMATS